MINMLITWFHVFLFIYFIILVVTLTSLFNKKSLLYNIKDIPKSKNIIVLIILVVVTIIILPFMYIWSFLNILFKTIIDDE